MPTDLPTSARVVVIGGGVIGTSIAYHLAAAGVPDVLLIERDELASGSTSKAAGGVRASFSNAANIEMGLRGLAAYSRFAEQLDQPIDFERNGYLYLLSDQANVDVFTESVALQNTHGIPSEMIDPRRAQELSPLVATDGMLAACWSPCDGKATPESVVAGYAAAARRCGATIVRHCAVTGIESSGGAITGVVTERGTVQTSQVVCAAGAWSRAVGQMVGVDIPVTPVRRQIAFTEAIDGLPPHLPSLTIDFPSTFYFHPEGRGLALGWSDPAQAEGFDLTFELESWLEGVGAVAMTRAPSVLDYGIRSGWAGLYEITPDCNQIIDRVHAVRGLIVAAGFSGHGFLMGPATGEIVRDLILEREPTLDISSFRLDRFDASLAARGEVNIV